MGEVGLFQYVENKNDATKIASIIESFELRQSNLIN